MKHCTFFITDECAFIAEELLQWLRVYFTCDGRTPKLRLCPLERECDYLSDEESLTDKQIMVCTLRTSLNTGSSFQVLQTLREHVPRGHVVTYEELGNMALDSQRLGRFVGTCMRRNQIPLLVPCHRVVGASANARYKFAGRDCCQLKEQLIAMEQHNRS